MGPTEWSRWNVSLRLAVAVTTVDFSANYFVLGELATAAGLSSLSLVAGPAPKIPYALETDSPVGAAGFERLHLHLKVVGLRTLLAKVSGDQTNGVKCALLRNECSGSDSQMRRFEFRHLG